MGVFRQDQTRFKFEAKELVRLIEIKDGWQFYFAEEMVRLLTEHRIPITPKPFIRNVGALVGCNNRERAAKLVDVIGDTGWTWTGEGVLVVCRFALKAACLTAFVVLVMWAYGKVAG